MKLDGSDIKKLNSVSSSQEINYVFCYKFSYYNDFDGKYPIYLLSFIKSFMTFFTSMKLIFHQLCKETLQECSQTSNTDLRKPSNS